MTDAELLGRFVRAESRPLAQHAFAGLVRRHVDWVYSAARRMVRAELLRFGSEAAHEILREVDPVRDKALRRIDDFLDRVAPAERR